ncbi:acyltransferase family protein [Flavobacterium sp.]|uniref:acyltransferase family protein n=1 Tax=Flavobacterium sp. TaxID=239 RepID=UPI003751BA13
MIKINNRLRELDFLRGIAIILVLLRHLHLFEFTTKMGWIGVDLFFVLSGFLVSGLLFKEYIRYGDIRPKLFLIRRGFKIYPIYFLTYFLYLAPKIIKGQFVLKGFLADMFFVQNYVWGWGYAYVATWSLAIEEHFYFGFALLLYFLIQSKMFDFKVNLKKINFDFFQIILILSFLFCLIIRIYNNIYHPDYEEKNVTMTHLRMDSLFAGVFISYLYYFKNEILMLFFNSYKRILIIIAFLLLSFTPFIDFEESFFVRTFGFTFLYIAFGIFLIYFLMDNNINYKLNKVFSERVVIIVSKIGFSSYSIYIIHGFVGFFFSVLSVYVLKFKINPILLFIMTSTTSVLTGMFMTLYIEKYFLKIRDKYYPSRIN